ncbi:hypothetical protein KL864_25550 [Mycolicibacterium goodii]|uniref:hypothetical protein n=1 Tax=Mycolicibacterium goodii TaxID=134601 RepID=UPI001BDD28A9|nr:hypothetical protein [Mycolicibacterium goodii]MBU8819264.1 hypothetical protein [Mycolicibacterium goodii]
MTTSNTVEDITITGRDSDTGCNISEAPSTRQRPADLPASLALLLQVQSRRRFHRTGWATPTR